MLVSVVSNTNVQTTIKIIEKLKFSNAVWPFITLHHLDVRKLANHESVKYSEAY